MSKLHDQLIVIDGLNVSNFGRSVFEDMRRGGVTAANCTSSVWENFYGDDAQHGASGRPGCAKTPI